MRLLSNAWKLLRQILCAYLAEIYKLGLVCWFLPVKSFSAYARYWDHMSSLCLSVCLSVCNVGEQWSHRLEILETNYTDN